jgi:hypothetical protein
MARHWYVVRDGKEQGPITGQQLKDMATRGQLRPADPIRREDMAATVPARSVKGLFPDAAPQQAILVIAQAMPAHDSDPPLEVIPVAAPASRSGPPPAVSPARRRVTEIWQRMSPRAKLATSGCAVLLMVFYCGGMFVAVGQRNAAIKNLAEADALWNSGKQAEAIAKYRDLMNSTIQFENVKTEQSRVYGRVIDAEFQKGNSQAGKKLLDDATKKGVVPTVEHPEAKAQVAVIEAQKKEAEAKKKEEGRRAEFARLSVHKFEWDDAVKLLDHTSEYKGKKVRVEVHYDGGGFRRGDKLYSMTAYVSHRSGHFDIAFDVPPDAPQPNVKPGDRLLITFVCTEGSLSHGNEVTAIERP